MHSPSFTPKRVVHEDGVTTGPGGTYSRKGDARCIRCTRIHGCAMENTPSRASSPGPTGCGKSTFVDAYVASRRCDDRSTAPSRSRGVTENGKRPYRNDGIGVTCDSRKGYRRRPCSIRQRGNLIVIDDLMAETDETGHDPCSLKKSHHRKHVRAVSRTEPVP